MKSRKWLGTGLVLLAAIPVGMLLQARERELDQSRDVVAQLNADIEALTRQVEQTESWTDALRNDPEAVERVARERMGYVREGEWVFRMEAGETDSDNAERSPETVSPGTDRESSVLK